MSCFIAYVLIPPGDEPATVIDAIEPGPANKTWLGWGWADSEEAQLMTVGEALALRPEPESLHKEVYSRLVDSAGAIFHGHDWIQHGPEFVAKGVRNGAHYQISRTDRDGTWDLFMDDPRDADGNLMCPPWADFVRRKLNAHGGLVAIVDGYD